MTDTEAGELRWDEAPISCSGNTGARARDILQQRCDNLLTGLVNRSCPKGSTATPESIEPKVPWPGVCNT